MKMPSRRGLLKNAAAAAIAVTASGSFTPSAEAQAPLQTAPEKKSYPPKSAAEKAADAAHPPLFSSAISFGNLLFLAGVGAHFKGTIEEHTKHVLDELEKNLISAGSSLDKVLKVNVYLNDLKDYAAMNAIYATAKWGEIPPVRTTVSPAAGIPGGSLVEIDMIAHL